jgi:hydrogenase nickel incorporation protein HypB
MCATCGCGDDAGVRVYGPGGHVHDSHAHDSHAHDSHAHDSHAHDHDGGAARTVMLQQKVLAKNDRLAEANRAWLRERGIFAVNLMSSPGAGKTTLLERTAREAGAQLGLAVIEGDQETTLDAGRIESAGAAVVQINTGAGCHLDAAMVAQGLHVLEPRPGSVVVIENVGNLVCPALFDLGEQARVVIASVTEGADKPLKYPQMFRAADLVLLAKVDLLPYLDFDVARHAADLKSVSPHAEILPVSATTGEGMSAWYGWLRQRTPADR